MESQTIRAVRTELSDEVTGGDGVSAMTSTLSAFPIPGPTMDTPRRPVAASTPHNCASFSIDRPSSSISRRHSWTSIYDFDKSSAMTVPKSSDDGPGRPRKTAALLPRPGATFDMAYFLKNTGPPPPREMSGERRAVGKKKSFTVFKKRKDFPIERSGDTRVIDRSLVGFVPPERVEQKVTLKGKRYLQIVTNPGNQQYADGSIARSSSISQTFKPKRLSVSFSDHTDILETEALDTWISTFTIQHKEADLSVKTRTNRDLQTHQIPATEVPRRSHSFKPELRSWLPATDSGFGLSIIDEPAVSDTCTGVSNRSAALGSNPPTNSASSAASHQLARSESSEITALTEMSQRADSMETHPSAVGQSEESSPVDEKDKLQHRQSVDRLAGEGIRRPVREKDTAPDSGSEIRCTWIQPVSQQTECPTEGPERIQVHDFVFSMAGAIQARRNREAVVRARKIRELQRARQNVEAIIKERSKTPDTIMKSTETKSKVTDEQLVAFSTSLDTIQQISQQKESPDYKTGYTPLTGTMRVSPVMLVAEQIPISRGRRIKKPARLVLRDRRASKPIAIAVRTSTEDTTSTTIPTPERSNMQTPILSQEPTKRRTTDSPPRLSHKRTNSFNPAPTQQRQALNRTPSLTPPGLPPKSAARFTGADPYNHKHLSTTHLVGPPQAVTATTTSNLRTSVCSSHTSLSKEARLEARVEALERENRLLEAALMAVLKTSGTLNRCPCVLLSKRQESGGPGSAGFASKRGSRQMLQEQGIGGTVKGEGKERRGSVESALSNDSGVSALEVYLGTRLGT